MEPRLNTESAPSWSRAYGVSHPASASEGHLHIDRATGGIDEASRAALKTNGGAAMAVSVYIPTPFRKLTGNRQNVEAHGDDVAAVLADVDRQYPGFRDLVFGSLRAEWITI